MKFNLRISYIIFCGKKNILKGKENMKCKITRKVIFFFYIMHHSYYYIIYNWQINWHFKLFEIGPRILLFIPHNHIIIICLFFENMNIDRLYSLISRISSSRFIQQMLVMIYQRIRENTQIINDLMNI